MNQKVVAITVAVAAGVAAFFVSGGLFKGTRLNATTKPKLASGWSAWQSWEKHAFVSMPPAYVELTKSNVPVYGWVQEMADTNPKMQALLDQEITTPDHVLVGMRYDPAQRANFVDHFVVKYKTGWPKMSLEQFAASLKQDPGKAFPGAKNVVTEEVRHPNGNVLKVEYDKVMEVGAGKARDLHATAYVFVNGDDAHLLEFRTLKDRAAKTKPVFDQAFEGFRVTF